MTVAAIVQARMASSRLPGKAMLDLGGKPVLHRVLERCRSIAGVDKVVCAVPDDPKSRPLEETAADCGAAVFRGPEDDVLARYTGAAKAAQADVVLRVTSDCPLIDPQICADVIALRARENADYAANNMPRSFPHGLDCEAFTAAALERAAAQATAAPDREHVTPWLRRAPDVRKANLASNNPRLTGYRWTLDYEEDLAFLRALFAVMPGVETARMAEIVRFLDDHPEIAALNESRRET